MASLRRGYRHVTSLTQPRLGTFTNSDVYFEVSGLLKRNQKLQLTYLLSASSEQAATPPKPYFRYAYGLKPGRVTRLMLMSSSGNAENRAAYGSMGAAVRTDKGREEDKGHKG